MPSLENARKAHEHLFRAELEGPWKFLGGVFNRSTWRASFPGGSWIQWVSAEQASGNRGLRCDIVTPDEADDIDIELHDAVVLPWFSEPHSLGLEFICGTPTRGRYGLLYKYYRFGLDGEEGFASFHATYRDVPKYVAEAAWKRAKRTSPPALFQREWECNFDSAEGLVYAIFSEGYHVREPDPRARPTEILVGVDHGYEDAGVFVVCLVFGSGQDAVVHVVEEVYEQHRVETWWVKKAQEIRSRYPGAKWYADPSQPARIEALKSAGISIRPAENAIEDGVNSVADRIARRVQEVQHPGDNGEPGKVREYARFFVSPRCVNTIAEFGKYRRKRDPRNKDRILDDIEDKNNHAMDSIRYAVFSRFGSPPRIKIEEAA